MVSRAMSKIAASGLAWCYSNHHTISKILKKGLVEIQALFTNSLESIGNSMPAMLPHN